MDPAVATLQSTINRFAAVGGFARVGVDGIWGSRTQQGAYDALAFIGQGKCYRTACPDDTTSKAAAGLMVQWDGAPNAARGLNEFIAHVADELALPLVAAPIPVPTRSGPIVHVPVLQASLLERFKAWPLWQQIAVGVLAGFGLIFVANRFQAARPQARRGKRAA